MRRAPRPVGRQDGKRAETCCRDTEMQACKAESREARRIQAWLMTEDSGRCGGPVEGELALLRILVPGEKYSCGGDGRTSPSRGRAESTLTIRRERMSWTAFKSRPSPHQETPVRVRRREMGCVCQFSFQIHQEHLHFSEKGQTAISSGPSQKRLSTQPVGTGEGA